jgi:hypothetical protein
MQNPILELKELQKQRAKEIKELKNKRPLKNRGNEQLWKIQMTINSMSYQFRHYHIAYCEFCGTRREDIERTVRRDNKANEKLVDAHKEELKKEMGEYYEQQETVCDCAA